MHDLNKSYTVKYTAAVLYYARKRLLQLYIFHNNFSSFGEDNSPYFSTQQLCIGTNSGHAVLLLNYTYYYFVCHLAQFSPLVIFVPILFEIPERKRSNYRSKNIPMLCVIYFCVCVCTRTQKYITLESKH